MPQQQPTPVPQQPQTPSWPQQPQTPSWPQTPAEPQRKGGFGSGLLIGVGVTVLLLVLACVGFGVWASTLSSGGNGTPTPQVSQRQTPGTQVTPRAGATPVASPVAALDADLTKQLAAGDQALEQADFNAAATAYQQVLDKAPESADVLARLALLSDLTAHYKDVVAQSEKAVDAAGDNSQQEAVAQALLADGLVYTSEFEKAVEAATKASQLDGDLGLAHAALANAAARLAAERLEKDKAAEVQSYITSARSAVDDDPEVFKGLTYSLIGDAYMSLHDLSDADTDLKAAKEAYSQALKLSEQPLFHAGLGFANNRSGDYGAARGSFNKALELDSTFGQAQLGLGWSDFSDPNIDGYDKALEGFDKALTLTPDDPWTLFARGRALFAQEKYAEATDTFRKAADAQKDSLILSWLGRSLQRQGYNASKQDEGPFYEESAQIFKQALDINDRQVVAWTYLGWTQQYQEKYDDSIDAFHKAIAIDDQDAESHNGLAWSLYNLQKHDEAEKEFRRATELDADYENAFYGLGQALEKLGKIDDAKQAYRDALKANPEYKDAQDALDKLPK